MLRWAGSLIRKTLLTLAPMAGVYALFSYVYNNYFAQSVTFNRKLISHDSVRSVDYLQGRDRIKVLIVTGGGVRGLIPLYVLQHLERGLGRPINEVFDVFAGVSTGAVIATGVNIPGDAIPDHYGKNISHLEYLINVYKDEAGYLFGPPWYHKLLTGAGLFSPSYFGGRLHEVMEKYYTKSLGFTDLEKYVIVPSLNIDSGEVCLFKNRGDTVMDLPTNSLYQLMTAAVSAETAFPPVSFEANRTEYKALQFTDAAIEMKRFGSVFADAAIAMNNPASMILRDIIREFPNKEYYILVLCSGYPRLLSSTIGYHSLRKWGRIHWARDALANIQRSMDKNQLYTLEIAKALSGKGRIEYDYLNVDINKPFVGIFDHDLLGHLRGYSNKLIEENKSCMQKIQAP
ncbi:patatin-like phospholipase family protein [Microbulbifer sp. OS29]|uniref:Patatin-like phospholipase family protein n=1 Tax=Microbulbifer okhotskensis TaxID=2926617 RepID=A0A9X2EMK8_9GAMM|nr:patatin-like phospholipase family protein [Microbulbifer okhotskensis]MCO1334360.1 patatin-like phospholipase family protein [Microbulbifer okhotskensis]